MGNVPAVLQGFRFSDSPAAGLIARAPQIAAWVIVLAVGAQAAVLVGDLLTGPTKPPVALDAKPSVVLPPRQVDLTQIVSANLFGAAKPEAGADGNAPATAMSLVLTGVIAGEDPQRGLAILGPSAAATKVIAVGDLVPGGARLHSVFSNRVLIDRNGSIESLSLPRQYVGQGAPPPPPPVADGQAGAFNRVQRVLQEHPNIIGDVMSPQAVLAQGKLRGYRVYPGTNSQAFQKLGLRAGDLVTHINGTALDDPTRSGEILNTLSSASDARVTVMRSGRQQDLVLNLAQVAAEAERISEPAVQVDAPPPSPGDAAQPPRQD